MNRPHDGRDSTSPIGPGSASWPGAAELRDFLHRSARRLAWIAAAEGATGGVLVAFLVSLAGLVRGLPASQRVAVAAVLVAIGIALRLAMTSRSRKRVAFEIERAEPQCRNLLVTAAELLASPESVRPYIGARVTAEAAKVAGRLEASRLFPARRALIALIACTAAWSLAVTRAVARTGPSATASPDVVFGAAISGIEAEVIPPAYSGMASSTLRDPARLQALAGSRVRLTIDARADAVTAVTPADTQSLVVRGDEFGGELSLDAAGYIVIEARAGDGGVVRRLIGVTVTTDASPRVRITEPAADLFLPDADRSLDVAIEAEDDIALASLALRFTKVSGSGEQFTFTDGELPLAIDRTGGATWSGRTVLRLDTLGLGPGDVLVYRGVAADGRPGAEPAESDAFIVEITSPGAVAAEGFAIDDEQDRYALSQQMVILGTQRLIARAAALHPDTLERAALSLAAQQRTVRAEFVFMMGGELAEEVEQAAAGIGDLNEEDHAEADDEAIAGRLENRSRFALIRAIRSMSRAYDALTEARLADALIEEQAALDHLQDAFSRTRYILRALTEREQLDPSRRLTGELDLATGDVRAATSPLPAERVVVLRDVLAGIAAIAWSAEPTTDAAGRAVALAESLLRSDASDAVTREIAGWLGEVGLALEAGRTAEARAGLDRAAASLADVIAALLPEASARSHSLELDRLDGARTDALRRGGGR